MSLSPSAKKDSLAVLFLAAATVALFWPLLFGDQILFFGDISLYFTPLLHFQQTQLVEHGHIPLWNPTILCGTPFVGNPQAWPLYPSSLLLYALSAEKATGVMGAVHILWAALGTYAFLRARHRSRAASLLSALAWGLGGVLVSKMQFPNMVQAASWLPWLLLASERLLMSPTACRCAVFGAATGLALLAAHPQMFLLETYVVAAWCLWRLTGRKEQRRLRIALLLLGFALGIGLAAAQLLPTIELVRHSVRPDLPLEKANRFILPPYAVLTNFLAPNFYGNPALSDSPYIGRGNFWEPCCYLGVLPFLLFVYGAVVRFREHEVRFWLLLALIGTWLAVGRDAGLFRLAFYILPGINRFHDAARFLFPGTFAIVCVAAAGLDHFLAKLPLQKRRVTVAGLLLLTALDVGAFSRTLNPTMPVGEFRDAIRSKNKSVDGRLFQADEGKIWSAFISYRTYDTLLTPQDRHTFLQSLAPNVSTLQGWTDAAGYEPVRLASIDALMAPLKDAARKSEPLPEAMLDRFAVEQVARWDRVSGKATVSARSRSAVSSRALLQPTQQPATSVRLATDIYPEIVDVTLPPNHPEGLVRLADAAYPGWKVSVDGQPAAALVSDSAFRGVIVPKEAANVRWTYEPTLWRLGVFVSLLAAGIITAMCVPALVVCLRRQSSP